jgi:L-ribulose-5-phosphate 3-epimerase
MLKKGLVIGLVLCLLLFKASAQSVQRYQVAVADIMILKRQKIGEFQLTKEIGADGVELDMGGLGDRETFDSQLVSDTSRRNFLAKAKEFNVQIPSMGMTGFFSQSFATRPTAVKAVADCITTMQQMGVKVGFLPMGVNSDLTTNPELRPVIVSRLKEVGKIAEKAGVIIGIETTLPAKDELALLKEVASPAIKSYFNFQNALDNGRDLEKELETLGAKNIVMIHCSDTDGELLQNDSKIDMKKVKATLDKMGWSGWLVIERSRDAKDVHNVKMNFGANSAYVKSIFQTAK